MCVAVSGKAYYCVVVVGRCHWIKVIGKYKRKRHMHGRHQSPDEM